ncbi:uncharacterized protein [Littorina saxatilis]|uniref:uncharacterized protein n=1 Tax=Littorina saxatilis TaxID=31220 RepID=UPI0038B55E3D
MAYDVDTNSSPYDARRKTTPMTKGPGVPKGESGRIPGPRVFCTEWCSLGLSGVLVRLMLLLVVLLVDLNRAAAESGGGLTILEQLIVGGRCQARCNAKYGYQERHRQIDLFDHYMPYTCAPDNHFNCTQCSKACLGNNYNPTKCKQHCQSDVCKESCDFLNDAFREESEKPGGPSVPAGNLTQAASSLTLTKPKVICTYTDMKTLATDHRSLVRLYWNVRDVTNVSTSLPLTFVIAIQKCADVTDCPKSSTWRFFGKTVREWDVNKILVLHFHNLFACCGLFFIFF